VLADAAGADIPTHDESYPRAQQVVGWLGEAYRVRGWVTTVVNELHRPTITHQT
jgi:hypothetical protein